MNNNNNNNNNNKKRVMEILKNCKFCNIYENSTSHKHYSEKLDEFKEVNSSFQLLDSEKYDEFKNFNSLFQLLDSYTNCYYRNIIVLPNKSDKTIEQVIEIEHSQLKIKEINELINEEKCFILKIKCFKPRYENKIKLIEKSEKFEFCMIPPKEIENRNNYTIVKFSLDNEEINHFFFTLKLDDNSYIIYKPFAYRSYDRIRDRIKENKNKLNYLYNLKIMLNIFPNKAYELNSEDIEIKSEKNGNFYGEIKFTNIIYVLKKEVKKIDKIIKIIEKIENKEFNESSNNSKELNNEHYSNHIIQVPFTVPSNDNLKNNYNYYNTPNNVNKNFYPNYYYHMNHNNFTYNQDYNNLGFYNNNFNSQIPFYYNNFIPNITPHILNPNITNADINNFQNDLIQNKIINLYQNEINDPIKLNNWDNKLNNNLYNLNNNNYNFYSNLNLNPKNDQIVNNQNVNNNVLQNLAVSSYYKASYKYEAEAYRLLCLNLFKGVSKKEFDPDLGSYLSREQAAIILLRLIGQEEQAEKMNSTAVDGALASFSDANEISSWARKQVAYATNIGIIKGFTDGKFYPSENVTGKQYASLLLQEIGFTNIDYEGALEKLVSLNVISVEQMITFDKNLLRDDVVYITYKILNVRINNGKSLIENLIDKGSVNKKLAEEYDLIEAKTPT